MPYRIVEIVTNLVCMFNLRSLQETIVFIELQYSVFCLSAMVDIPLILDSVCIFGNTMIEWYIRKRYDSLFLIAEYNEMLYLAF